MTKHYLLGRDVFEQEIRVLSHISASLDETFDGMVNEIRGCHGKVILIGMGKSGHIARKIAATMSSLGCCAIALNPAECMHGDLGMIQAQDVVIMISSSGESEEIVRIIPGINHIGATLLGITCNRESTLMRSAKLVQVFDNVQEVEPLRLAPTSSSTAVLVYGDALAVTAARLNGFSRADFSMFHPAGSLGKKLTTRTVDLMHPYPVQCMMPEDATLQAALSAMLDVNSDLIVITNSDGYLSGILTNGDLKKVMLNPDIDLRTTRIGNYIHRYPYFIDISALAIDALRLMVDNHVHAIPVVKNDQPVGIIHQCDIIKYGIYL